MTCGQNKIKEAFVNDENHNNESKIEYNSTVTEVPQNTAQDDLLDMSFCQSALVDYINHAQRPITIALQGEWGRYQP